MITIFCYDNNWAVYQRINPDGTTEPRTWDTQFLEPDTDGLGPNLSAKYLFEKYCRLTAEEKAAFRELLGFPSDPE
jgi:hypothetical protein